jgi:hypothetical protein
MDNQTIKQMLGNIKNEGQRNIIERMMFGKIKMQVTCQKCKNLIAYIKHDDSVEPVIDKNGVMWLLASRPRLDGLWGFQCLCGNDSRLCQAEKGNKGIENNALTTQDVQEVLGKLEKKQTKVVKIGNANLIDNFILEDI